MLRSSIDIGTNSVLLLVCKQNTDSLEVIFELQRLPRLGKGVDKLGRLSADSMKRVLDVLLEFNSILTSDFPTCETPLITATSAVRDAKNKQEFLAQIYEQTGWVVRLLSGEEEAKYTYLGALSQTPIQNSHALVIDIGGGSTELSLGTPMQWQKGISLDMGCVRYNERFLHHNPPFQEEIGQCVSSIQDYLTKDALKIPKQTSLIAVSGTATSLVAIDAQIHPYDSEKVNNHRITQSQLAKSIDLFRLHTYQELIELHPEVMEGRADIFLTGLLILNEILNHYKAEEFIVSSGGIRHGILVS